MMKKYFSFISESSDNMGKEIEYLIGKDEYLQDFVNKWIEDIDPSIELSNAINLLPKPTVEKILKKVKDYKKGDFGKSKVDVVAHTDMNQTFKKSIPLGGKNTLNCFLKIITALGQKDISSSSIDKDSSFIILFKTRLVPFQDIKSVMSRFNYFSRFLETNYISESSLSLYYAITDEMKFEYGLIGENKYSQGEFNLTRGMIKSMLSLSSPSSLNFKKELISLDLEKINLIIKIKDSIKNHSIKGTYFSDFTFGEGIISFNFRVSDDRESSIKKLRDYLLGFKWHKKIQINLICDDISTVIKIKIK